MVSGIDGSQISQWTLGLFDQLDSQNKGYIDKSGLATALDKVSGSSADVEDIFTRLDANSDGKVTKDEMTTVLQELFAQARSRRVMDEGQPGGPDGMPPPPPPNGEDKGFTADELSSQLEQIGSADSKRSELISNILKNFDEADADGDGKVTAKEAMAFDKANKTSDSSSVDSENAVLETGSETGDAKLMMQIMKLLKAYQTAEAGSNASNTSTQFSVSA